MPPNPYFPIHTQTLYKTNIQNDPIGLANHAFLQSPIPNPPPHPCHHLPPLTNNSPPTNTSNSNTPPPTASSTHSTSPSSARTRARRTRNPATQDTRSTRLARRAAALGSRRSESAMTCRFAGQGRGGGGSLVEGGGSWSLVLWGERGVLERGIHCEAGCWWWGISSLGFWLLGRMGGWGMRVGKVKG